MKRDDIIPIRFAPDLIKQIDAVSEALSLKRSPTIKFLLHEILKTEKYQKIVGGKKTKKKG